MGRRPFRLLVAAVVVVGAINCVMLVVAPQLRQTTVVDDYSETLSALLAATACIITALRGRGRIRQAWGLVGIAAGLWGLGQAAWTYQEVFLHLNPADLFPSFPDLGYLLSVPFAIAGLLRLPGGATTNDARLRTALDGIMIAGALLFISWDVVLGPVYASSSVSTFAQIVGLAYPISDIAMVTIVVLTLSRLHVGQRLPLVLLAFGVLLNAVADSSFAFLTTLQSYTSVNFPDLGWTMGYALIGLAALRALSTSAHPGDEAIRQPRWTLMLPYLTVAAAGVAAVVTEFIGGSLDRVLEWDLILTITVVLARQYLFARETHSLNEQVARKNEDLDLKVDERTRALVDSLEDLHRSNDERTKLLLRLVTIQEQERQHVAGIIHDDMLQSMIAAKMRMFLLHRDGEADEATAASIESSIEGAIVRMRTMLSDLHPHILELGLRAAVEQSISEFNDGEDLVVTLTDEVSGEPSPIVATTLYRIIREALTNARKHARGASVTVFLNGDQASGFGARISDNGPGFAPRTDKRSPPGHLGLSSMRERAEALGGWVHLDSAEGAGTAIEVWLPQKQESVAEMSAA
ncbi:MAG: sensor histidine kinase [Candidatus Dormiibacterota bacterium]